MGTIRTETQTNEPSLTPDIYKDNNHLTSTWPTMGPPRDERGLPKRHTSHEDNFDLSSSINFTCGSGESTSTNSTTVEQSANQETKRPSKYTANQWMTLVGLAFANFATGACVSLQAPFFPEEAERKGATATEYGLVFGIYQLTYLIGSFFFGKVVAYVSPSFTLPAGIFVVGSSAILFGVLDRSPPKAFIPLAIAVRVAEGIGSVAAKTATYSIIGVQFPDTVATIFASMETCLGVGLIIGPTVGGALYQLGGYLTPFLVTGVLLLLDAVLITCILPKEYKDVEKSGELWKFWKHSSVVLDALAVFTTFVYYGFQSAALEPHIRQFGLSPILVGSIFVVCGATYALTAPAWGRLIDKGINVGLLTVMGCVVLLFSEAIIGPASFLHMESKLWMVIFALFLTGLGGGAKLVSTFISCLRKTIARGFPNDLTTYGLVSTMYSSALSLGAFTGPTLGGYLLDVWGFNACCSAIMVIETCMVIIAVVRVVMSMRKRDKDSLLPEPNAASSFEASYSQIY